MSLGFHRFPNIPGFTLTVYSTHFSARHFINNNNLTYVLFNYILIHIFNIYILQSIEIYIYINIEKQSKTLQLFKFCV